MNKKNIIISVVAVIVIILFLGAIEAVKPQQKNETAFSFADSTGAVVSLSKKPERVAVLFSSLAEIWKESGGTIAVTVGESVERGFCEDNVLLVDDGAGKTINTELLVAAEPDFVIVSADLPSQRETAELLRRAGISVAEIKVESFEDYSKVLSAFSKINGTSETAKEKLALMKEEIESIKKEALSRDGKKILFIRSGSSYSSAKAKKAEDHFAAKMLEELGCFNIADEAEILVDGLSTEEILKQNPEHIFISLMGDEETSKAYMEGVLKSEAWQSLKAVKAGNVHFLPKALFQYKPCGKWTEAYDYLNKILGE